MTSRRPTWLFRAISCPGCLLPAMPTSQPSWSKSASFFNLLHPRPPRDLYLGTVGGGSPSPCPAGSHPHPPQELTQHTLRCRTPPHPNQEQLCQHDTQPEKISKHHIGLSSRNSCLSLSFSYSFVVNGLGGKRGWKGLQEPVAAPHPGAARHRLPSLFPKPLAMLPPLFLLHCSLGKFFTQISCWDIFLFSFSLLPDLFLLVPFPWPWGTGYFLPVGSSSLAGGGGSVCPRPPSGASHVSRTRPPHGSCHPSALPPPGLGVPAPIVGSSPAPHSPQHCPLGCWGWWLSLSPHLAVE